MEPVAIRPFRVEDQQKVCQLILDGLGEHFGNINEELNPDLDDIAASYAGDLFLVAEQAGVIVGCGALIYEGDGIARVQRMSVLGTFDVRVSPAPSSTASSQKLDCRAAGAS